MMSERKRFFELHVEQRYVHTLAEELSIPLELISHSQSTDTCYEKAALLGWEPRRVIKAIYFGSKDHVVGIVSPELGGCIPAREILGQSLGLSLRKAKRYRPIKEMPSGMEYGTCTPFALESSVGSEIHDFIVVDMPSLNDIVVDISIGGMCDQAHKTSLHLPYGGIYGILKEKFEGLVHKAW
jgi:hypothetical protein